ncbi:MAG: acetate/propionate family kinase, partial [Chitinispirillia bacterium]
RIRRYGFHGTSHLFVAKRAAESLGKPLRKLSLITIHLGNGASMAAIKNGKCIDTSMGMTPLDGLIMGTRSGDYDAALPFFLHKNRNMEFTDIENMLNTKSGLKGICGTNDMREILSKYNSEDIKGKLALEMYTYRIKKNIGAYFAVIGNVDAVIFTGGIGENAPEVREMSCRNLENLGIKIDRAKNFVTHPGINNVSSKSSVVPILVIPTNEELEIAIQTQEVVNKNSTTKCL